MDRKMSIDENPGGCRGYVTKVSLVVFFLVYVLLGAYVFLLIETSTVALTQQRDSTDAGQHPHTPPIEEIRTAIERQQQHHHQEPAVSEEMMQLQELMTRQVLDRLWDITENLNILYKENWTRLAADEITRLHASLHQIMKKDCAKRKAQEPVTTTTTAAPTTTPATVPTQQVTYIKWTYSAAFLYALSVITTLGSCPLIPETNEAKVLTIIYAAFGIPLLLVYLTVVGSAVTSCVRCWPTRGHNKRARHRRTNVDPSAAHFSSSKLSVTVNSYQANEMYHHSLKPSPVKDDLDSLEGSAASSTGSSSSRRVAGVLRSCWPVLVCLWLMVAYVASGAWLFSWLLSWPATDALLLSFMLFTTMGMPDADGQSVWSRTSSTVAVSLYLLTGLTLCSFCFHLVYEWIVWRWTAPPSAHDPYRSDPSSGLTALASSRRSSRS